MGRASSAKKLRRQAGYNQRQLKMLREFVELASSSGGMVKLVIGSDGELAHWGIWTPQEDPTPACGALVVKLEPDNELDEPTCPECLAMPEEVMAMVRLQVRDDNEAMLRGAARLLELMRA